MWDLMGSDDGDIVPTVYTSAATAQKIDVFELQSPQDHGDNI